MNCTVKLIVGNKDLCIGPGLIALLEQIADSSSVMEAASHMGISYSKAWKLIREAEKSLECKLVIRKSGGPGGGQAEVSEEGKSLIGNFRKTEAQVQRFARKKTDAWE